MRLNECAYCREEITRERTIAMKLHGRDRGAETAPPGPGAARTCAQPTAAPAAQRAPGGRQAGAGSARGEQRVGKAKTLLLSALPFESKSATPRLAESHPRRHAPPSPHFTHGHTPARGP
jgi:hypothetical protein